MKLSATSTAIVLLLMPTMTAAQTTCASVTNCPPVNQTNTFTKPQALVVPNTGTNTPALTLNLQTATGTVSPKNNPGIQIVCVPFSSGDPECNNVDSFAYGGYPQFDAERYDISGSTVIAVGNGEPIGYYTFAPYDGASDAVRAFVGAYATEAQSNSPAHHGTGVWILATENGTSATQTSIGISPGGLGGVTIGNWGGGWSGLAAKDLGNGTVHAQSNIETDGHFVSNPTKGTLSSCGTGGTVDRGGDNAGQITTGGSVTSCTYNFAQAYSFTPICLAQVTGSPSPTAYVNGATPTTLTIGFSSAFSGHFWFICQGITS